MQKTWLSLIILLVVFVVLTFGYFFEKAKAQNDVQANSRPGDYKRSLGIDGRERSYVVHIPPAYTGQHPVPLVIVLHGGGGNAEKVMATTGMSGKADRDGFIVVYPNGTGRLKDRLLTWNAGNCCGYALDQNVDDVGFIRILVENLQKEFNIDPKRIYATGMSNGARMAYHLGCALSDKLAAIAPVAGSLDTKNCRPVYPLSVIAFHGTGDTYSLYEGGMPQKGPVRYQRVTEPVANIIAFWATHNQCSSAPQKQVRGNILQETYSNCKNGAEVILYTVQEGGHAWPGGKKGMPWGDEPTQEISATDLMWDFFLRHPKN